MSTYTAVEEEWGIVYRFELRSVFMTRVRLMVRGKLIIKDYVLVSRGRRSLALYSSINSIAIFKVV